MLPITFRRFSCSWLVFDLWGSAERVALEGANVPLPLVLLVCY